MLQDHRVMFTDFIKSLYRERERERERERDKKLCKILSGGQYGRDHVSKVIRPFIIMLPRISQKIAYRWIGHGRQVGHCCRHPKLTASRLVLWELTYLYNFKG